MKELLQRAKDAGFTPSRAQARELAEALAQASDDEARTIERALLRAHGGAIAALTSAASAADPKHRARAIRALGRFPDEAAARAAIADALRDDDAKVRRAAANALGRVRGEGAEDALLAAWKKETADDVKRALAEALGKVGSRRAVEAIEGAATSGNDALRRVGEKARTRASRNAIREEAPGAIDAARAPTQTFEVELRCRPGLEPVLEDELAAASIATHGRIPGGVRVLLSTSLATLFAARTWSEIVFPLPLVRAAAREDAATIARAIGSPEARAILAAFSDPPWRHRVAWQAGGHRRALVLRVAGAVRTIDARLINDPIASTWRFDVSLGKDVRASLVPAALVDPRFAYRVADVPAASHPTIAAALAHVAGVRDDDVVWDPFVGSGAELVERARLGPYAQLLGSDVDARALEAAKLNLDQARLSADLELADATMHAPAGVTLIITNPPMGRRVGRDGAIGGLLDRFVAHAAHVLVRGGRLVWLSPFAARSAEVAGAAGLDVEYTRTVDMGGFPADLQRLVKR